jgi:hypothetical protein
MKKLEHTKLGEKGGIERKSVENRLCEMAHVCV